MNANRPIGVFDSGSGGLSVVRELHSQLPGEDLLYFADTANVPYGGKSYSELLQLGERILAFFKEAGVKVVVAACNTSSAVSIPVLKPDYPVPIITVLEPGAAEVARVSQGRIGVMATRATVESGAYARQINKINPDVEVIQVACPALVPLVEAGIIEGPDVDVAVNEYLQPLIAEKIDTLVLGCTHYPFLINVIKHYLPTEVTIVDPALPTINELENYLRGTNLLNPQSSGEYKYYSSGSPQSVYDLDHRILHLGIKKVTVVD